MEQERRESCIGVVGRLQGLAGTVRHEMSDELRAEIREIANELARAIGADRFVHP